MGGAGCYDWRLQVVSWPSGGAHRAPEVVASPWWRPFRSRFAFKKRARKRGNLSIADTLRDSANDFSRLSQKCRNISGQGEQ
eukprot:COSAG06_NODE_3275_length_5577_cov_6.602410_7_plen_82_part_00